jgi:hypothetical protein
MGPLGPMGRPANGGPYSPKTRPMGAHSAVYLQDGSIMIHETVMQTICVMVRHPTRHNGKKPEMRHGCFSIGRISFEYLVSRDPLMRLPKAIIEVDPLRPFYVLSGFWPNLGYLLIN